MGLVLYETDGPVAKITINRPEVLNALNSAVVEELDKVVDAIDQDVIRCVIITGAGQKSFVAGADIAQMRNMSSRQAMDFSTKGNDVFHKIGTFPVPVIAAVNGFALGGGCELALSCDIRICSENAMFGQPEVGLGITPGFGGTQRLSRMVGQGMAKQMIYSGRPIDAQEALRVNLVNAVYKQEDLMPAAVKLAKQIAANAPIAVKMSKKAINASRVLSMDEGKIYEERCFGECFETHDQVEGMSAFLEKRKEKVFTNS